MKVRAKNPREKALDQMKLEQARYKLAEFAIEFWEEFADCDDVFTKTRAQLRDKVWEYEREKNFLEMSKVGPHWDAENGVCGKWRYEDAV